MYILLPVFVLVISGLVILIFNQLRPNFGYSWLISLGAAIITWILIFIMRWRSPDPIVLLGWNPIDEMTSFLVFHLDLISWPYAFSIATLILAGLLTSAARLESDTGPKVWVASLIVSGSGLLAILAGSPTTLILAWTIIDLEELFIILGSVREEKMIRQAIFSFSVRVVGTMLVVIAMVYSRSHGRLLNLVEVLPDESIYLLIAVALRLGLVPIHLPYTKAFKYRRELGTMLRLVGPASGLTVLGHLSIPVLAVQWMPYLSLFIAMGVIYNAVRWLTEEDELTARPYWIVSITGMAVMCVLNGQNASSVVWGAAMILVGGVAFLYSARHPQIQYIPLLAGLGFAGFPFSPTSSGWKGLIVGSIDFVEVIIILAHFILMVGMLRHFVKPDDTYPGLDGWVRVVYPIGLLTLVLSHWLIGAWGWHGSYSAGFWWISLIQLVLISLGVYLVNRYKLITDNKGIVLGWLSVFNKNLGSPLSKLFGLNWLYGILLFVYGLLQKVVVILTTVLEGEGGVLWALLLLTLLISFIFPGGTP
ncbi:MAG: hypothetical protein MUO76_01350 [Anaerolineaceae bacterium]|nr:hypothetical protein [Anaerolineaceae bacterium]